MFRAVGLLVEANEVAKVIHAHDGGRDAIRHHELGVGAVHVLEALRGAARHFDIVVSAGGSLVEPHNLASIVDAPCLRDDRSRHINRSIGECLCY